MNFSNNCGSIKQLLRQQFLAALDLSNIGSKVVTLHTASETIPVHRLSDDTCVMYRSAIALKLAPLCQRSALDIANLLMASFSLIPQDTIASIGLDFSIEVVLPGWIYFRLSEQSLGTWLQQVIYTPSSENRGASLKWERKNSDGFSDELDITDQEPLKQHPKNAHNLFLVQYAHARCCSLLRLAHREGLIKLRHLDYQTLNWQLVEPNPIPWLNDNQGADRGRGLLRLEHSAERRLITQIIDVQDAISDQGQGNGVRSAQTLSQAFEEFYSRCRIWGEVKSQNPKLAQARLGLVGVTQVSLRTLLQDKLGVTAPVEL